MIKDLSSLSVAEVISMTIRERRSIRLYNERKVDRSLIEQVLEAGRWAPSACNNQGWHFLVIDDDKERKKVFQNVRNENKLKVLAGGTVLIYVLYDSRLNPEKHANIQSASAAIQNMLLMAHTLGLGACWYSNFCDGEVRKHYQISDQYLIIAAITLGYPARPHIQPTPRKPLNQICSFNELRLRRDSPNPRHWDLDSLSDLAAQRLYYTSPEIGGQLQYVHENRALVKVLSEWGCSGKQAWIWAMPGNLLFPYLEANDHRVTCFEPHPDIVRWMELAACEKGLSGRLEILLERHLVLPEGAQFQVIVLAETLNRLPPQDRLPLLRKWGEDLKPEGRLLLIYNHRPSLYSLLLRSQGYCQMTQFWPREFLKSGEVKRLLNQAGLVVRREIGVHLLPSPSILSIKFQGRIPGFGWVHHIPGGWGEGVCTLTVLRHLCRLNIYWCEPEK